MMILFLPCHSLLFFFLFKSLIHVSMSKDQSTAHHDLFNKKLWNSYVKSLKLLTFTVFIIFTWHGPEFLCSLQTGTFLSSSDCISSKSFASNHEPKFLADDTGVIAELPTRRLEIVTLASCWDVPMIRNSILSSFSFNLSSTSNYEYHKYSFPFQPKQPLG